MAEVIHQINLFLASPLYAKNLIFHSFRAELKKQAPGYEDIALHLLAMAQVGREGGAAGGQSNTRVQKVLNEKSIAGAPRSSREPGLLGQGAALGVGWRDGEAD